MPVTFSAVAPRLVGEAGVGGAAVALGADGRIGGVEHQAEVGRAVAGHDRVAAGDVVRVGDEDLLDAMGL